MGGWGRNVAKPQIVEYSGGSLRSPPATQQFFTLMNNTSTITIRLFAGLREIVGQDQITIPWHENLTVAKVKQTLQQTYPELEPQFKAIMMARNGSYCKETQLLLPNDEIAFIPPVSGG